MTEARRLISITFPLTGLIIGPRKGEKYIDETMVDKVLSAALKEFEGYSHELIYTYDDGSTEKR